MDANGSCYIITYLWSTPVCCPFAQPTSRAALTPCTVLVRGRKTSSFSLGVSYVLRAGGIRGAGGLPKFRNIDAKPSSLKELLLHTTNSPTTFFDLPPYLSCVLFSLVTHVQSRTSLQYSNSSSYSTSCSNSSSH